jgi:hypothetical protein
MARGGNDHDKALEELRSENALHKVADQFADGVGNAEQLIDANAARRTADLATVSSLPVIQAETDELDLDDLKGPDGEFVIDASVRGSGRTKGTVVVYEDEFGRVQKWLADANIDETGAPVARDKDGKRRSSHKKERGEDAAKSDAEAGKQ